MTIEQAKGPRQVILDLVEYLNSAPYSDTRAVWAILTALRGPDEDDPVGDIKFHTVAKLRGAIGLTERLGLVVNSVKPSFEALELVESPHLRTHLRTAYISLVFLGFLTEEELNADSKSKT